MATIGKPLTVPEAGWRRYDDTDSNIVYTSDVSVFPGSLYYNGGACYFATGNSDSIILF